MGVQIRHGGHPARTWQALASSLILRHAALVHCTNPAVKRARVDRNVRRTTYAFISTYPETYLMSLLALRSPVSLLSLTGDTVSYGHSVWVGL